MTKLSSMYTNKNIYTYIKKKEHKESESKFYGKLPFRLYKFKPFGIKGTRVYIDIKLPIMDDDFVISHEKQLANILNEIDLEVFEYWIEPHKEKCYFLILPCKTIIYNGGEGKNLSFDL